jgi:hypothetical protein
MKKATILLFLLAPAIFAQQPTLFPHATWLQDVHFAGTVYQGIPAPLIPGVQAHLGGLEYMFHVKSDVEKALPLIAAVHAQGKKYWVNLDGSFLEGNIDSIIADGQGITDPRFGACKTLEGQFLIVGGKNQRGITNPEWRNFLVACIKRAVDAGADGSQHDCAWTVPPEAFDESEMIPFKEYMASLGVSTGGWNPATQTFRQYLLGQGKTDATVTNNDSDPDDLRALMHHWYEFKSYRTRLAWQMLKDTCSAFAASKGKEYTIALNGASNLGSAAGSGYTVSDFAIGEFFDWGQLFPYDGLLTARVKAFHSIGKRFILWSPPTLTDIPLAQPTDLYPEPVQTNAVLHTAATLYASGGLPQLGYPSAGTYPAYFLAQAQRGILNSVSPAGDIGVVMSHAQTLEDGRGFYGLLLAVIDLNRACRVIRFKPDKIGMTDDLTQSDLEPFKVLFIPEAFRMTDNQRAQVLTYVQNGGTVIAVRGNVEYSGCQDQLGADQTNTTWASLADRSQSGVTTYGAGRFITIAHHINESNGYPPPLYGQAYTAWKHASDPDDRRVATAIRDTIAKWLDYALPVRDVAGPSLPATMKIFRFQDTLSHSYVYQMLNDSVEIPSRAGIAVGPLSLEFAVSATLRGKPMKAMFYSIDAPQGTLLGGSYAVDSTTGRVGPVPVPPFKTWGFVHITEADGGAPPALAIAGLTINDTTRPYRLKSRSAINLAWSITAGTQQSHEVEVWTNVDQNGVPVVSDHLTRTGTGAGVQDALDFVRAKRVVHLVTPASQPAHTIPASSLKDSTVYLVRVRAISAAHDTTGWLEQYCYRNSPPAPPIEPSILVQSQSTWYLSTNGDICAGTDTSSRMIYSFKKGFDRRGGYGGDWELDTLLYGIVLYTDSLTGRRGDTAHAIHRIGDQFRLKLGPFESKSGTDDQRDTLQFSLASYENFGIYFRTYTTDMLDTSAAGQWFGYFLDSRNDPPNPFTLISPPHNGYVPGQVGFRWKNNKDPDPFNQTNRNISQVRILFDSVSTFDSPGLKTYTKSPTGNEFEGDTISLQLPANFFVVEGIQQYRRVFWKVHMWDYDRAAAQGGGQGPAMRESSLPFALNIGTDPGATAQLTVSVDSVNFGPVRLGMMKDSVITLQNPGMDTLRIISITGTGLIFRSTRNSLVIPPGGSRLDTLRFSPNAPGAAAGQIIIMSNASGSPDTIRVRGFGASLAVTYSRTTLNFGNVRIGTTRDSVVIMTNTGNQTLTVASVSSSVPVFTPRIMQCTIPAAGAVADTIRFSPTAQGPVNGWILVTSNARTVPDTVFLTGNGTLTGIGEEGGLPAAYQLLPAYPNPFNPATNIRYGVPERSVVELTVFNLLGQEVMRSTPVLRESGYYEERFEAAGLSSGVYLYRLEAVSQQTTGKMYQETRKMVLMR